MAGASTTIGCVFCNILLNDDRPMIADNALCFAVIDHFPVNPGHALIIPKRHVTRLLDLSREEVCALHDLLNTVQRKLAMEHKPDGFNIGVNEGEAAGQTIFHLHVHVIPRYAGDVDEPQGGIRNIKKALVAYRIA